MDARIWIAVSYIIITFVFAAGWHLLLFKKTYEKLGAFTRKKPIIALGIASIILQALVVAYAYPIFAGSESSIMEGLIFGVLFVGLFMGSSAVLAEAGKNEVGSLPKWITIEGIYYIIQGIVIGVVLGIIY